MNIAKVIKWPPLPQFKSSSFSETMTALRKYLQDIRQVLDSRDREIAKAINASDVEVVTTEPTEAPGYGEPCFKIYNDGSDWHLYCYAGGGWRYATLTDV